MVKPVHRFLLYLGLGVTMVACDPSAFDRSSPQDHDWPVYLGDKASSQYAPLTQINKDNVQRLDIAWTYHTGDIWDEQFAQIQTNPLIIDGILYGASPAVSIFALDARTGEEIWRFDPSPDDTTTGAPTMAQFLGVSRGMAYWADGEDQRILFVKGSDLFALNARTGAPIASFGQEGRVDLRDGLGRDVSNYFVAATTPGVVYKDLLIQGMRVSEGADAAPGHIRAYNIKTGELAWTFHTIPHPGEVGYETWPPDAWQRIGGANNWAGMSVDEERGIVYVPTGSASFDFWGGNRKGQNLFANSLIALNAETGERIWHYQTVHHDIWDRDLPAPPNLLTIERDGERIDAVAQITKSGFVFVFDRETGEPLFPVEERPVPTSDLRGEETWPTQPFPLKPAPFARQRFTEADINDLHPETHAALRDSFATLRSEGQFIPFDTKGTIIFPGFDGGGEWGGAAVDPDGVLYVNANEMPWVARMVDADVPPPVAASASSLGELTYAVHCASCHGDDRAGGPQQAYPSLINVHRTLSQEQVQEIIEQGRGFMPSFQRLSESEKQALVAFLFGEPEDVDAEALKEALAQQAASEIPYMFAGYHRFVDAKGYPAVKPPWGTLNAIDLNTGEYRWTVTLGELPELTAQGIPPTGTENYGGPVVTAGGLLFIAATKDEMFRAFDKDTGELLWETKLPAGGYATPSTYMVDGKQYVVIAAGGGKMGTKSGDTYVAFALLDE